MSISTDIILLYHARWYITGIVLGVYTVLTFRAYRRLSKVKGPWIAQFTRLWLLGVIYRQRTHLELYSIHNKYGPLVRIAPNMLSTIDVDQVTRMNAPRSKYLRSEWYLGFRLAPGMDNVLTMRDENQHKKRRAQMNLSYTGKKTVDLESTVDVHVNKFVQLIKTKYLSSDGESKVMDLCEKAGYFTMDVIIELATGASFGNLTSDSDQHDLLRLNRKQSPALVLIGSMPWVLKLLQIPFIGKRLFPSDKDKVGYGRVLRIVRDTVTERFNVNATQQCEKPDIMQSFINHNLSLEEAISESLILIAGGSDSTASVIPTIMLCLMTSPQAYRTLQAEIDGSTLSAPVITDKEARGLPYLQAVILEGLRLHTPLGGLVPKIVPPEGDIINGIFVPGGTEISVNAWAIMRNEIFGEDVECFRPERWLTISDSKYAEMARIVDLSFGSGRFKCLGRTTALVELNKVLVELLRNFDWALVDQTHPWKTFSLGFIVHSDMYVRVTSRVGRN